VLRRYRRYFVLLAFGLLATPLVVGLVKPDSPQAVLKEGRYLAPAPKAPVRGADWIGLPKQVDAYLRDHFGLRQVLIRTNKDLTKPLLGAGNDLVMLGRDGRMFYLGEDAVRQSSGLIVRDRRVADAADMIGRMNEELRARGVRFLVAMPPNGASIYPDDLPHWAQNPGKLTEYDLLLSKLAAKNVPTVDLRSAVKLARAEGPVFYKHDTHWTPRGALAAFNAIVEADAHPDWRLSPAAALGPPVLRKGGDLARMFGVSDGVTEYAEEQTLPHGRKVPLSSDILGDFSETTDKPGSTVLILGDSFTGLYFPPMLLTHVSKVVWLHHRLCGFDWNEVEKYHPDEVWWMPTERFLVCAPGERPTGLSESKAVSGEGRPSAGLAAQVGAAGNRDGARE
jgi:alginate O-acetyltransferase complex protein AlgJ